MGDYINKATKDIIVSVAACIGLADRLMEIEFRNKRKANRNLKAMKNQAEKLLDIITEGTDINHLQGVMRYAENCELICFPKHSLNVRDELNIVKTEDIEKLIEHPMQECAICTKSGKDSRRCKLCKTLISMGIVSEKATDCPYAIGGF